MLASTFSMRLMKTSASRSAVGTSKLLATGSQAGTMENSGTRLLRMLFLPCRAASGLLDEATPTVKSLKAYKRRH